MSGGVGSGGATGLEMKCVEGERWSVDVSPIESERWRLQLGRPKGIGSGGAMEFVNT